MLQPYSASTTRRWLFHVLFAVAVLGPVLFAALLFVRPFAPEWLAFLSLRSGAVATLLLCIWSAVYVREEPALVRVVLIWGAVLSLLLTVGAFRIDGTVE